MDMTRAVTDGPLSHCAKGRCGRDRVHGDDRGTANGLVFPGPLVAGRELRRHRDGRRTGLNVALRDEQHLGGAETRYRVCLDAIAKLRVARRLSAMPLIAQSDSEILNSVGLLLIVQCDSRIRKGMLPTRLVGVGSRAHAKKRNRDDDA